MLSRRSRQASTQFREPCHSPLKFNGRRELEQRANNDLILQNKDEPICIYMKVDDNKMRDKSEIFYNLQMKR